jgi:hypothetical protein
VILELKFTNRFPNWFRELVQVFDLRQCGAAKYVDGIARFGESRLDARRALEEATGHPWPANGEPVINKSSIHTMMMEN